VWHKVCGEIKIKTYPMHLQYTIKEYEEGEDIVDQLQGFTLALLEALSGGTIYSQDYMLDTTLCNDWVIHSDLSFQCLEEPMTPLSSIVAREELSIKRGGSQKWRLSVASNYARYPCTYKL